MVSYSKAKEEKCQKSQSRDSQAGLQLDINHPNAIHSPIASDTILVKNSENEKT
jgi:hypothetical protein